MATEESKSLAEEIRIREEADQIAKYDPEMRFRKIAGLTAKLVFAMTITPRNSSRTRSMKGRSSS